MWCMFLVLCGVLCCAVGGADDVRLMFCVCLCRRRMCLCVCA